MLDGLADFDQRGESGCLLRNIVSSVHYAIVWSSNAYLCIAEKTLVGSNDAIFTHVSEVIESLLEPVKL